MAVSSKQKTVLAILVGALVAIAPSFFSYLQARQEIREKYKQNHVETETSYETLVTSVKDLQKTALEQHDYIVKLEGQIATLTNVIARLPSGPRVNTSLPLPKLDKPPTRPDLPAPPDFATAQMAR